MKLPGLGHERQTNKLIVGMAYILTSAFFFACMSLGIRLLRGTVRPELLVFLRALFQIVILSWGVKNYLPTRANLKEKLSLHFVRGGFGTVSMFFMYVAMQRLPIAVATLLTMTSVFWAAVISWIFLKETLTLRQWIAGVVVLLGIALSVYAEIKNSENLLQLDIWGVAAGLAAGFCAGSAYTALRSMRQVAGTREIVFFFGCTGVLLSGPLAVLHFQLPTHLNDYLLILYVAVCATLAQLFMTEGFRDTPATIAGLVNLQQITFSVILGAVFLKEIPPGLFYVGAFLVLLGLRDLITSPKKKHEAT